MDTRPLGRTGLKVSSLCLGTMTFGNQADEAASFAIMDRAWDAGIFFFDTSDVYPVMPMPQTWGRSEEIIGAWLRERGVRDQLVLATKVRGQMGDGPNDQGLSRAHILSAVEGSLLRLGTDYIDLYQTHSYDQDTPIEETLTALDDLVSQGKVRYIGCSNYPAWRLTEAIWTAEHHGLARYDSLQPHYNIMHRGEFEREPAEVCRSYSLGVIPYSPLAGGFLTGKYRKGADLPESARSGGAQRYFNERNWTLLDKMEKIGTDRGGCSISQVALAWLLSDPLITSPIIGPRSLEQLHDNLGAAGLRLAPEEKGALDEASDWRNK